MLILMLSTRRGAADGFTLRDYFAGQTYDLSGSTRAEELAQIFMREGWAEDATAKAPAPSPVATPAPTAPAPVAAVEPEAPPAAAPSPPAPAPTPADRPKATRRGR